MQCEHWKTAKSLIAISESYECVRSSSQPTWLNTTEQPVWNLEGHMVEMGVNQKNKSQGERYCEENEKANHRDTEDACYTCILYNMNIKNLYLKYIHTP